MRGMECVGRVGPDRIIASYADIREDDLLFYSAYPDGALRDWWDRARDVEPGILCAGDYMFRATALGENIWSKP